MATQGTVYTSHFEIEPRQHEILGIDLGEGPSRRGMVLGLVSLIVWAVPVLLIFGAPTKNTATFYILPPALIIAFGLSRSVRMRRRIRLTEWVLAVRYAITSRPIIRYGARKSTRSENLPLAQRWSFVTRGTQKVVPVKVTPPWEAADAAGASAARSAHPAGRSIHFRPRTNVIGAESLFTRLQTYSRKKRHP